MKTYWQQQLTESASPIKWMLDELEYMLAEMNRIEEEHAGMINKTPVENQLSAKNLLDYLIFRSYDIREMQDQLHGMGLSSLASAESHIRFQLTCVIALLEKIQGVKPSMQYEEKPSPADAASLIHQKRLTLFGKQKDDLTPNLMVTLPSDAANDRELIKNLMEAGMNIARINLAHDTAADWYQMAHNIEIARKETGLSCKIYMDLPGPKIRTTVLARIGKRTKKVKKVKLNQDESLIITGTEIAASSKQRFQMEDGQKQTVVGCTIPALLQAAKVGDRIYFDDGKFACNVTAVYSDYIRATVSRVPPTKPYLKQDKGINFPDSQLQPEPLTDTDRELLPIVCELADLVGYSFVGTAKDVQELQHTMLTICLSPPALILKIERQTAVDHLAELLLQGMQLPNFGVMIARGDLGIEVGFERLSEIQEEILWMCEAAHAPVIWATQVMETLNKTGLATRAEISDVALASAADCIMLNKGSHVLEALTTVHNIAQRMQGHMLKKRYILRPLSIARRFTSKN